jgi:hypothetical protein
MARQTADYDDEPAACCSSNGMRRASTSYSDIASLAIHVWRRHRSYTALGLLQKIMEPRGSTYIIIFSHGTRWEGDVQHVTLSHLLTYFYSQRSKEGLTNSIPTKCSEVRVCIGNINIWFLEFCLE